MTYIAPASCQTRLGENHGYRFEGDFVFLNAEVGFSDDDLAGDASWALQLWASESGFAGGLNGVKVAEMAIQPLAGGLYAEACCTAMPPAAGGEQTLALALVVFADGRAQVRDLAVYGAGHHFFLPYLGGNVSCWLADGSAELAVDSVVNPRLADNLSGTLALEVWALDMIYAGGSWTGSPVATVILGVLAGGEAWTDCQFAVPAAMPTPGAALTVMLREWTPAGYVTRDYRNFAALPVKADVLPVPAAEVPPVVKAQVADAKPVKAAKAPAGKVKKPLGAAKKPGTTKKPAKKAVASKAATKAVSVNKASEAQLSAVKGLPPSVARAIIAARPFASLEEVCKAKGMGPKMLAKLRDQFVL